MKLNPQYFLFIFVVFISCQTKPSKDPLSGLVNDLDQIAGNAEYINSPFVTAGDRVYMVGHQNGTFPDLGFHVEGEMGGIWNHPIKLMDGFTAAIISGNQAYCLDKADEFINFPVANKHVFTSSVPDLEIQRFQFVPDGKEGMVIEFEVKNVGDSKKSINFEFTGYTDLMPAWLGERVGMEDHEDILTFDEKRQAWMGKDEGNDWYVLFGSGQTESHSKEASTTCHYSPQGKGKSGKLTYNLSLSPGKSEVLTFFISGSYQSEDDVKKTYDLLKEHAETYLRDKIKHYQQIAEKAKITIPDKGMQRAYEWVKYNTEWLVRDVPEVGRGLGAGIPDYPWWFGVDNEYTLKGAIATGRKDLVYSTIELIHKLSGSNGNGRVIHEASTTGVIFNPGNINETPQFASLIWTVYQWTGDKEFLEKYYPFVLQGMIWLMEENDEDGNLFPDGYGMMEIHGLESEMIDVAVYTQKAFDDVSKMAVVMDDVENEKKYRNLATELKQKINEEFWVEEFNSYADFIGTASEALTMIDAAIIRADTLEKPWAVEELKATRRKLLSYPRNKKGGFVMFHNWVVNTPMEMGIADEEKALKALDKGKRFVNPFGVFVTGIDRDDASEYEDGSFAGSKVFSYTGAVMTLPTGVQAVAENNYGRPDEALDYLKRLTRSFSYALPGSIYEVSPDYGMMTQAWNLYAYAVPIVTQFFGIQPDAGNKKIHLRPMLPTSWEEAKIENVTVGDNELDLSYQKKNGKLHTEINLKSGDWEVHFDTSEDTVILNGKESETNDGIIVLTGKKNKLELPLK
ncbi:glycogen debranching protein [Arthrospiribacter ruber]|uniref:Glycogen debranching protein n=1 Tax=Arthrospiribacter ruber TaxID=2487934 RepID=A0A951MFW8_9BACT|nr:glycogen debranching protein [Arthrospiribacter ruber]MBW3469225.1 glycogen debranching protein [Arthrospiribacter ruber]